MKQGKAYKALCPQHKQFVLEYTKCANGAKAAIKAGYAKKSAKQLAYKLLIREDVKKAIEEIQDALFIDGIATRNEALFRLSEQMRGSCIDYLNDDGTLNVDKLKQDSHRIKKFKKKTGKYGVSYEFELHDSQGAIAKLAQMQGWNAPAEVNVNASDKLVEFLAGFNQDIKLPCEQERIDE